MKRTPKAQYRTKANEREDSYAQAYRPTANRRGARGLLPEHELQEAFLNSATAARIVTCVPDELFRCGFDIEVAEGVEFDAALFRSRWDELHADRHLAEAYMWSRLDGGGAVVVMTAADDMQELLPGEEITDLRSVSRTELDMWPGNEKTDPNEFGMPLFWAVNPLMGGTDIQVHNSRLIKIKGRPIPPTLRKNMGSSQKYFGLSVLQGILGDIYDFDDCHQWATLLLQRLQQLVYKTEGAGDQCESRAGTAALQRKVDFVDGVRSVRSTIAIDKDTDDVALLNGSLTGVKDVLDTKKSKLTQSSGIPQIVLAGDASGALNNSAEGAMQSWQNYLAREQVNHGTPAVSRLVSILYPDLEFSVVWRPIQEETLAQLAERLYKQSQADSAYAINYILTIDEIRDTLKKRGDYVMSSTKPVPPMPTDPTNEEIEATRGKDKTPPAPGA
jgi:phage-related protein (TIGR01555 family)